MKTQLIGIAILAIIAGTPAIAADMEFKAPPPAPSGAFYASIDGSYQSINLPTFDLGWRVFPSALFFGPGNAATSFDPRVSGAGTSGALGYILPNGSLPTVFGSNVRVEIGGSYVHASGSQFATATLATNGNVGFSLAFLNGAGASSTICPCIPFTSPLSATLATSYTAWTVNGKVASDFRSGVFTATPSLAIFGGRATNNQSFDQQINSQNFLGVFVELDDYRAQSNLAWTDVGVKGGLDLTADVTSWIALGIGSTLGVTNREVSLSANDSFTISTFVPPLIGASAMAASASATPLLAGANANVTVRPLPAVQVRGFVGLNYDSAVPGIAAPQFVGATAGGFNPITTPASIKFAHETSYYAGGGLSVRFGP